MPDPSIQQWEYEKIKNSHETNFDLFVKMGEQGWEYAGDAWIAGSRHLIFKRPKQTNN